MTTTSTEAGTEIEEEYDTLAVHTVEGKKEYRSNGGEIIRYEIKDGCLIIKSMEPYEYLGRVAFSETTKMIKEHRETARTTLSPNYWYEIASVTTR